MNVLPFDHQIKVISALTEGCSIRATERLTDTHRDTIMRLGVRIGEGCARLHNRMMRGLQVPILEFDEVWGYVGKKQRRVKLGETDKGDTYTFVALDAINKTIIAYVTGKRNEATTRAFVNDVWERSSTDRRSRRTALPHISKRSRNVSATARTSPSL